MTTLQCHQVSRKDNQVKTVYLEELVDANLVTADTSARTKEDDRLVLSVKVKGCRLPCDLAFRMGRNLKSLTTAAWNDGLPEPKVGRPVVLNVIEVRHCAW